LALFRDSFRDSYEVQNNSEEWEKSEDAGRLASIDELLHLLAVCSVKNCGFLKKNVKEADVRSIFGPLSTYFEEILGEGTFRL
jgi:hypothetical protein